MHVDHEPLGHLDLDHRLSPRHRRQVREVGPWWVVGPRGDDLVPADIAGAELDLVVADLRRVVRDVLEPCGVGLSGVVVVATTDGLVTVTASDRRVVVRRLGPRTRDRWAESAPTVEECRVVRIDALRPLTADRGDRWPC